MEGVLVARGVLLKLIWSTVGYLHFEELEVPQQPCVQAV